MFLSLAHYLHAVFALSDFLEEAERLDVWHGAPQHVHAVCMRSADTWM